MAEAEVEVLDVINQGIRFGAILPTGQTYLFDTRGEAEYFCEIWNGDEE